jgi:hypothetical protein
MELPFALQVEASGVIRVLMINDMWLGTHRKLPLALAPCSAGTCCAVLLLCLCWMTVIRLAVAACDDIRAGKVDFTLTVAYGWGR